MKFNFIFDHRETFKVGRMCNVLRVSRSGYYAWIQRPVSQRSIENRNLQDQISVLHAANHGLYGAPKIHTVTLAYDDEGDGPWLTDLAHKIGWDLQDGNILISRMNGNQASIYHLGAESPELPDLEVYTKCKRVDGVPGPFRAWCFSCGRETEQP